MAAFNMDSFNLTTVTGFLGVMFSYFTLMLSIAAAMWGSDIISKEERDKTVEFSLTLPVKRSKVVTAKTLAAVVNCFALLLITGAMIAAVAGQYNPDSDFNNFLFLGLATIFVLQLIFLAVGVFLGCAMKQHKRASAAAVSVLLGTYFLSIISSLSGNLEFLKYFTPFRYFNTVALMQDSKIEIPFLLLSVVIVGVLMYGAYATYQRRDLYI
jgi:ABC-2 type transport system permease protein